MTLRSQRIRDEGSRRGEWNSFEVIRGKWFQVQREVLSKNSGYLGEDLFRKTTGVSKNSKEKQLF